MLSSEAATIMKSSKLFWRRKIFNFPLKLHRYYINPCIFNASINPSDIVRQSLAV